MDAKFALVCLALSAYWQVSAAALSAQLCSARNGLPYHLRDPGSRRYRFRLRLDSKISIHLSGDTDPINSPTTSIGKSSELLKRTHDLPMSSFLPAALKPSRSFASCFLSPYTDIR